MMEATFRKVQTSPLKKLLCLGIKTKATGKTNRLSRLWDFQTHRLQACFLIIITNLNINKFFRINLNTHNQDFFPSPRHSGSLLKYQCKSVPYNTVHYHAIYYCSILQYSRAQMHFHTIVTILLYYTILSQYTSHAIWQSITCACKTPF